MPRRSLAALCLTTLALLPPAAAWYAAAPGPAPGPRRAQDAWATDPFRSGEFVVDPVHSGVIFSIEHLGVARFYGRFNEIGGRFQLDREHPERSSVELVIPAASVDTNHPARDRHVRSADFLHVEEHPEIRFRSTAVQPAGPGRLAIAGELTARGVTRPVSAEAELVGAADTFFGDFRTGVEARFGIDRHAWGIAGVPGGLGERIEFIVALEGVLDDPGAGTPAADADTLPADADADGGADGADDDG